MGRKPKVEYSGAIYHVVKCGNYKEQVFYNDDDKEYFLYFLEVANFDNDFNLLGYVIMDNHYHLIIETKERPLQKIVQQLNNAYIKNYNKRYQRDDNALSGRYKAILVNDDTYLLSLLRYLHQNPVRVQLCKAVEDYPWSSDHYYRNNTNKHVNIDKILKIFCINRVRAIDYYKSFIEQMEMADDVKGFYEEGDIIGEDDLYLKDLKRANLQDLTLDDILSNVVQDEQLMKLIKEGSRKRVLSNYKKQYVLNAYKQGYKYREIGKNISISAEAANRLVR